MNRAQTAGKYRYLRYLSLASFFSLFVFGPIFIFGFGTVCSFTIPGFQYSCPFGVFQNILTVGIIYWGLLLTALLIIIATLFLGRFFCGWICPVGAILAPIGKALSKVKAQTGLPRFLKNKDIKYGVLLGAIVGAVVLAFPVWCIFCPVGGSSKIATPFLTDSANLTMPGILVNETLQTATPSTVPMTYILPILGTAIILVAVALELTETRAWCRYFCGLGAAFAVLSGISNKIGWQVRMPMDRTIECGACVRNCPMGIPILAETREKIKADPETEAAAKQMGVTKEQMLLKARKDRVDQYLNSWGILGEKLGKDSKQSMPEFKKVADKYSISPTECIKCFTCVSVCPVYKMDKKEEQKKAAPTNRKLIAAVIAIVAIVAVFAAAGALTGLFGGLPGGTTTTTTTTTTTPTTTTTTTKPPEVTGENLVVNSEESLVAQRDASFKIVLKNNGAVDASITQITVGGKSIARLSKVTFPISVAAGTDVFTIRGNVSPDLSIVVGQSYKIVLTTASGKTYSADVVAVPEEVIF